MRINSRAGTQEVAFDDVDAGEGLAVFFSQNGESTARYRFLVKAIIDTGVYDVGEFYSSPPLATVIPGRLSRMIAGAVCPGATSWRVSVSAVRDSEGQIPEDTADIILASTRCFAQMGVTRVAERYNYAASNTTGTFTVQAGMRITGIAAYGLGVGATVVIAGGNTITVPTGVSIALEPGVSIPPNSNISITNCDWVIEYVESA